MSAFIVFDDNTTLWWLKGLRRGFRHCFAVVDGFVVNPLASRIEVFRAPIGFLAECRRRGMRIVAAGIGADCGAGWRFGMLSCVSVVSRILGLRQRFWTPFGLYRFLIRRPAALGA
jgi:hypothetical protein